MHTASPTRKLPKNTSTFVWKERVRVIFRYTILPVVERIIPLHVSEEPAHHSTRQEHMAKQDRGRAQGLLKLDLWPKPASRSTTPSGTVRLLSEIFIVSIT